MNTSKGALRDIWEQECQLVPSSLEGASPWVLFPGLWRLCVEGLEVAEGVRGITRV